MIDAFSPDSFCSNSAQGDCEQKFIFLLIDVTGNDVSVNKIQGKSPTLARVVVQEAQVVFEKIFRQLIITGGGLYLPALL